MTYKKTDYYIFENDLILFIKNKDIKNNKIKIKFLDDKSHAFKIDELKKAETLVNHSQIYNNLFFYMSC